MKNLAVEKLKTLLNDLEINRRKEEEDGKAILQLNCLQLELKK